MKRTMKVVLPALLLACTAEATPTPYPTDLNWVHHVTNKTTSSLIADDTDPHKVWVLPPSVGKASFGVPNQPMAHMGFCSEMGLLQGYSRNTVKNISELSEQMVNEKSSTDKILAELADARKAAAEFAAERKLQPLLDLDDRIVVLAERLTELYKTADTCKTTCDEIDTEIRSVEKEKQALAKDRRELAKQFAADARTYDKKKALVAAITENYKDAYESYNNLTQRLVAIRKTFLEMYSTFSKMAGVVVNFEYSSGWDENVENLRRINPSFQFEKVQTENVKVFATSMGVKDLPGDQGILHYGLAGKQQDGYFAMEGSFSGSLTASPLLSLAGSCALVHPEYFDLKSESNKMTYGMSVSYDFPAAMTLKATAVYNMYKMYEKIVSSGSRGGFFSSKSWSRVEERSFFKDSFNVDWKAQDAENAVTDERRLEIEHEMRAHVMERLANLALPASPDRAAIIAANPPPAHGAVVIAGSLGKACPTNIYCIAGAAILTSLDAIFGSSSSTASYMQTQNFNITESWANSKVVMKPWITSFVTTSDQL